MGATSWWWGAVTKALQSLHTLPSALLRPPLPPHSRFVSFAASQGGRVDKAISTLDAMVSKGRVPSLKMLNIVLDTCIKGKKTREVTGGLAEGVL